MSFSIEEWPLKVVSSTEHLLQGNWHYLVWNLFSINKCPEEAAIPTFLLYLQNVLSVAFFFSDMKLSYCTVQGSSGQGLFEQVFKVYKWSYITV